MQLFIFVVGFFVTMLVAYGVVYGIFAQVPAEIRPPEDITYANSEEENNQT